MIMNDAIGDFVESQYSRCFSKNFVLDLKRQISVESFVEPDLNGINCACRICPTGKLYNCP